MVALAGRIPVNVSSSSGPIVAGDYLTSSDVPGLAMKATKAGMVVGQALSSYDGTGTPKVMLFIKNMVFLDGAIASLAPDLDLFAEIAHIATYFATAHGARITADVGVDPRTQVLDLSGVKAAFGVDAGLETLTYRDLQARRALIRERLAKRDRRSGRRRPSSA